MRPIWLALLFVATQLLKLRRWTCWELATRGLHGSWAWWLVYACGSVVDRVWLRVRAQLARLDV